MLGERRDVQVKTAQQRMRMMAREAKNLSGTTFSAYEEGLPTSSG